MTLKNAGKDTLDYEITGITIKGIWVFIIDKEYYIPFEYFPMLKQIPVEKIFNFKFNYPDHLFWEEYDVDIELSSLNNHDNYPLIYKK